MRTRKNTTQRAFTLVELLVVIAIISLLAGLLLPALDNAIGQARSIGCLNNLKNVGIGVHLYMDIYGGPPNISYPRDIYLKLVNAGVSEDEFSNGYPSGNFNQVLPKGIWMCPGTEYWKGSNTSNAYDTEGMRLIEEQGSSASTEEMRLSLTSYGPNVRTMRANYGWGLPNNPGDPKAACEKEFYYKASQMRSHSRIMMLLDGFHRNHMRKWMDWAGTLPMNSYIFQFRHTGLFNSLQWDGHVRSVIPFDVLASRTAFKAGETADLWLAPHGIIEKVGAGYSFRSIQPSDYP